jgi:hypothetical protein
VFVKPSMSYFLGLAVTALIAIDCLRKRAHPLRALFAEVYPAALTGMVVGAMLAIAYGPAAVMRTVTPAGGLEIYSAQGFGFFKGAGRRFLIPPGVSWSFYLEGAAGPWLADMIVLTGVALMVVYRAPKNIVGSDQADRTQEVIVVCAALELAFILFFFGNEESWHYYFYIIVLGLAAAARLGTRWEIVVAVLALGNPLTKVNKAIIQHLAPAAEAQPAEGFRRGSAAPAIASATTGPIVYSFWSETAPSPETAGLWATADDREEWVRVRSMTHGRSTAILAHDGCANLLFPEYRPPVALFLIGGEASPADVSRELAQLRSASAIVMPRWHSGLLDELPAIGSLVRSEFVPEFEGAHFIVYARRPR